MPTQLNPGWILTSLALFPLLPLAAAASFRRKQNRGDWVGGPISWPKALWLAYTICTWFILPWAWLGISEVPNSLRLVVGLHLASWWIRGPLELIMIYKWLNWSPRYGIAHDLFHIFLLVLGCAWAWSDWNAWMATPMSKLTLVWLLVTLFATWAEALFAYLFLRERQAGEELIYFASEEARWHTINRITLTVVMVVYAHLALQSCLALALLIGPS
jgi:hypothetical protein